MQQPRAYVRLDIRRADDQVIWLLLTGVESVASDVSQQLVSCSIFWRSFASRKENLLEPLG